jgi:outer membrane protein, multidrug efflux system
MSRRTLTSLVLAAAVMTSGCGALEPRVPEAAPSIPAEWPLPAKTVVPIAAEGATAAAPGTPATADIGWRDFFVDPRLQEVIALALANNRDLRVAVLNVERARALYRIERADRVPSVGATAGLVRTGGDAPVTDLYTAGVGITEFELDLFGRVRNLSQAALQEYFAQEEARRSAQLTLIAEVASAYLALAADQEQLRVVQLTLATREEFHALTQKRYEFGAVSALDVSQSRTQVEAARADVARFSGQAAQTANALQLLVGAPVGTDLLPQSFGESVTGLAPLPAGMPSEVLLRRPDVLAAEHRLRAENANIGAARAAFFPSIKLTGSVGSASDELSGLFDAGTGVWLFAPQVNLPLFEGGRLRANLDVARTDRDIALAQYERAIQAGFRDVADALALTTTLADQRAARQATVDAATEADRLALARYKAGRDSYLVLLESQRSLYLAQQTLIVTRLSEQTNRVTLYKALGGGWLERGP